MTRVEVPDPGIVAECLAQMRRVQDQIDELHSYTSRWVAGERGFTGLLRPFVPVLAEVAVTTGDVAAGFRSRYEDVIDALALAAADFDRTDQDVAAACSRIDRGLGGPGAAGGYR